MWSRDPSSEEPLESFAFEILTRVFEFIICLPEKKCNSQENITCLEIGNLHTNNLKTSTGR